MVSELADGLQLSLADGNLKSLYPRRGLVEDLRSRMLGAAVLFGVRDRGNIIGEDEASD